MQVISDLCFSPLCKDSSTFMVFNLSFVRWEFSKAEEKKSYIKHYFKQRIQFPKLNQSGKDIFIQTDFLLIPHYHYFCQLESMINIAGSVTMDRQASINL